MTSSQLPSAHNTYLHRFTSYTNSGLLMACDPQQRGFSRFTITRPCLLPLAVMAATALLCALPTTTAQPQPPALPNLPSSACLPARGTLFPCISYFLSSNSSSSSPAAACCSQVQAMFESQAPCLCAAMAAAPSQLGAAFGAAQVLLPSACGLPPNACSSAGSSSTTTTTAAAAPVPAGTADVDPTAAGGGLKSVPGLLDSAAASGYPGALSAAAAVLGLLFVAYGF